MTKEQFLKEFASTKGSHEIEGFTYTEKNINNIMNLVTGKITIEELARKHRAGDE